VVNGLQQNRFKQAATHALSWLSSSTDAEKNPHLSEAGEDPFRLAEPLRVQVRRQQMSLEWLKNLGQSDYNNGSGDRSKTGEGANWSADQINRYNQGYNPPPIWPTWPNSDSGKA
jgi:hypothetical protein